MSPILHFLASGTGQLCTVLAVLVPSAAAVIAREARGELRLRRLERAAAATAQPLSAEAAQELIAAIREAS